MKTALITGGNRGIGRAIAEGLMEDHRVVIGVRDLEAGKAAAREIGCEVITLDLMKPDSFEAALAPLGGVDVLVNNAGVLIDSNLIEDPEGFETTMQVMVHAPYHLIRLCTPHMAQQGWGRIVNLSSGWGAFAENLEGPAGIKVNAMCPGWVATRTGGPSAPLTPEQGADTALWLARLPEDGPTGGFFRRRAPISW